MHVALRRDTKRTPRRVLWVLSCTATIGSCVMGFGVPMAQAHAEHALRETGLSLLSQLGPDLLGPPQAVSLNGERMWLASTVTPRSVSSVLDEFKQRCQRVLASSGVDQDGTGLLTCFAASAEQESKGLLVRARDFAQSGDLSRLGDALYAVARPDTTTGYTHVLSVWTEGRFNLPAMFPRSGDVPGGDSKAVPRPPNSIRILSAKVVERPYALHMYTTRQPSVDVLGYYGRELERRGFSSIDAPDGAETRAFVKDGAGIIVATSSTANGLVCVSLLELENPGYVEADAKESS